MNYGILRGEFGCPVRSLHFQASKNPTDFQDGSVLPATYYCDKIDGNLPCSDTTSPTDLVCREDALFDRSSAASSSQSRCAQFSSMGACSPETVTLTTPMLTKGVLPFRR
jgi:hypothetical protein